MRELNAIGRTAAFLRPAIPRLAGGVFSLMVLTCFCFVLAEWAPGDFLSDTTMNPQWSEDTARAMRKRMGLAGSLPQRYLYWLSGLPRGEFGRSYAFGVDAADLLWPRAFATAQLNASAWLLSLVLAAPLAFFAAARPRQALSTALHHVMQSALAIPELMAVLLLLLVAIRCGFPLPGTEPFTESYGSRWLSMAVPCLALALGTTPIFFRHLHAAWQAARQQPFVAMARHHGIPSRVLLLRYTLPAAANPVISLMGITLGGLLSASLVVESVSGWPGLGPLMLEAVLSRDTPLVAAGVLLAGSAMLLANLLADLLLLWQDPRIRR